MIVDNEDQPFHGEQYVVMGLTTRTWYEERIPLTEEDYVDRKAPKDSSIVPHSVLSVQPEMITDYVCEVRKGKVDEGVDKLVEYLY